MKFKKLLKVMDPYQELRVNVVENEDGNSTTRLTLTSQEFRFEPGLKYLLDLRVLDIWVKDANQEIIGVNLRQY